MMHDDDDDENLKTVQFNQTNLDWRDESSPQIQQTASASLS
jgi:hypothetical protein